jgi:outer membrane lipopolysaccharide assembly protein LptE/RlpB
MKKLLLILAVLAVFLAGCGTQIKDIKDNPDDYIGETVTVKGVSSASIKIGQLSGFTLTQDDGSKISISSTELPKDDSKIRVKGVVMKDTLFGVYILAKEVS